MENASLFWNPKGHRELVRNAKKERDRMILEHDDKLGNRAPAFLTPVIAKVDAYDARHAFEIAIDQIDLIRGLINLIVNKNRSLLSIVFPRDLHAFNRIRLGPIHSIHDPDGTLATEILWYEPFWHHSFGSIKWNATEYQLKKRFQSEWRALNNHPLYNHLRSSIIRYCRALDHHDPNT